MKKVLIFILFITAMMSLTSCGAYNSLTPEEGYKVGYNTGVLLRGGSVNEFIY